VGSRLGRFVAASLEQYWRRLLLPACGGDRNDRGGEGLTFLFYMVYCFV